MPASALKRLPPDLAAFAVAFAESGDAKASAISVGAHPQRAATFGRQALASHLVQEAIATCMRGRFAEAGPIALNVLLKFATNEGGKYSPEHQLTAARDLANRAGYGVKDMRDASASAGEQDLESMSPEDLRRVLETTEAELAGRAKLAEFVPTYTPVGAQVVDLEG